MNSRMRLFLFFLLHSVTGFAQNSVLTFDKQPLPTILQKIEKEQDFTFNYDPEQLSDYTFSGELILNQSTDFLTQLLSQTPFEFEKNGTTILIFLSEKQNFRLCGTLKDALTKTPLPFANIYTNDHEYGTQSDENGFFDFSFLAHKNRAITISYIGYQMQNWLVQDFDTTQCQDRFLVLDESLFGSEILVKDYVLDGIVEGESYSSINMNYHQLSNTHVNIEQDILKTVQLMPGISSVDESAANLQIRGSSTDQNLILWEDVTLYDPGHLFGMISVVNPFVVDDVKVFKGVFDPSYDNRVGGIVDMSLSDSIAQKWHGGVGSTLSEAHAFVQIPVVANRLSVLASGRNSLNQLYDSPTLSNYSRKVFQAGKVSDIPENQDVSQFLNYYDWNAKVLFRPVDRLLLKGSYFKSNNEFNYTADFFDLDFVSRDDVIFSSEAASFAAEIGLTQGWQTKFLFTHSDYKNDYFFDLFDWQNDAFIETNHVFNTIRDQTFLWSNQVTLAPDWQLQFGYDYNKKSVVFNVESSYIFEEDYTDFNFVEGHFHNAFAAFQYQKNKWQLNGGLRATFYEETQNWAFSPRFNAQYAWRKHLKLKASAGILQQYISQLQEFGGNDLGVNNQAWVLNRTETEATQEARKIATGLVFHKNGWLVDVEGYWHKTTGLSTISPSFRNGADLNNFSTGSSTARGLDFLLKKRWGKYQAWLNYSLGQVRFLFPEIEENSFPATNDQRHNLNLLNSWTVNNWNFSLSYQFRTGLPYSEPNAVNFVEEDGDEFYEIEYDILNRDRLKNYSRFDLGVSYRPTFPNSRLKMEIAASLINVLNQENVFARDYYLGDLDDDLDDEPELLFYDELLLNRTVQGVFRVWF